MGAFLSLWMQTVLLACMPIAALSLAVYFCRLLFVSLVGKRGTRGLLLAAFAPSTPLRELGHAMAAILFWHRVEDICLLDVHAPDGELGFVEHSYNPRNPLAQLGNFFYWMIPVLLGLAAVFGISYLCFGPVMTDFMQEISLLAEQKADFGDYFLAAMHLLPAMLGTPAVSIWKKLLGLLLLIFLSMGVFSSVAELIEGFGGMLWFALLSMGAVAVLQLFDTRVQRLALDTLYAFSVCVLAMFMVVFLCVSLWLALAAVIFLLRTLIGTGEEPQNALQEYRK